MDENIQRWSGLCPDVLEKIVKNLDSRFDIHRVRAVCSSWRSLVPLPPKRSIPGMPLKLPFPICPNLSLSRKLCGYFILKESTIYCLEPPIEVGLTLANSRHSCESWFVHIEEDLESGRMRLRHPLSVTPINYSSQSIPRVINLMDYKVSEIAKCYNLEFVSTVIDSYESKPSRLDKVVVSKSEGCIAVMVKNKFTDTSLGLWRMGDDEWTVIHPLDYGCKYEEITHLDDITHFEDIISHNGKFYAVYMNGWTLRVDPSSMEFTQVAVPFRFGIPKFLVKSQTDLFFIEQYIGNNFFLHFNICMLKENQRQWISLSELNGFEDQAFFLGDQCCFSVSAREFTGCMKNSIYFTDISFEFFHGNNFTDWDVGLFDIKKCRVNPLITDPFYAKIFWPPPAWLLWRDFGLSQFGSLRLS